MFEEGDLVELVSNRDTVTIQPKSIGVYEYETDYPWVVISFFTLNRSLRRSCRYINFEVHIDHIKKVNL